MKGLRCGKVDLDHINPSSRGGETDEFNLFPYKRQRHIGWHELFLNMQMRDIWENVDKIHRMIFCNRNKTMNRTWLVLTDLPNQTDLRNQIDKVYESKYLKRMWSTAFRGRKPSKAKAFLRLRMLFMIFGSDAVLTEKLYDNGNLSEFFKAFPLVNERRWAFTTCFGTNPNLQSMKEKIRKILNQSSP